ncbi:hypothetical protein ACFQY4_22915 [Catellatospora bangladeshensis]|uniref:hypothetical protein n=1 Tax=Catellatospora bangladeshensis TaxID=310355 RepID=UPI0036071D1D
MRRLVLLAVLAAATAVALPSPAHAGAGGLAANGSFEQARYPEHTTVSAWDCEPGTGQAARPAPAHARSPGRRPRPPWPAARRPCRCSRARATR